MRRLALVPLAALALFGLPNVVFAQTEEASCRANDQYLVAGQAGDYAGEYFAVYNKSNPDEILPCWFNPEIANLVFTGEYAFEGLESNFLILSEGTSSLRTLVVFELSKGKTVLSSEAELTAVRPNGLTYWERREAGTEQNCPEYAEYTGYGGGAIISHEQKFDFATLTSQATGQTRCDYLE